jgi:hypothetical protein
MFMRKYLVVLLFLLTACKLPSMVLQQVPLPAGTPAPTFTPSPNYTVRFHPDGALYVGDRVSIEVLAPSAAGSDHGKVRVSLDGKTLGENEFQPYGIGGRNQATFYWLWDTKGLKAGTYTLTFSLLQGSKSWTENIALLPADKVPAPEPGAQWESAESVCCTIHYISGTAAERDLDQLKAMVDAQAADDERRLQAKFKGKIPITFLPRVLGHGGFTSDEIYVSYLDQNYAGSTTTQVVHHEMVHWLDGQMGGDARLSMLQEGLAVFMSDGHFKVEPILPRAAALIRLNWYIPLPQLVNSFYTSQHEIGYMEAGAFTGYMIQTYGWDKYNAFYRDLHPIQGGADTDVLNAGLEKHFSLSLDQVEKNFTAFLGRQTVTDNDLTDVRLTVAFYDTVRRYQLALDPSAHFLTAWLVDGPDMRQRGIVADYLRHPDSADNQRIESLLVSADASLRAANYGITEVDIRTANLLLDFLGNSKK